MGVMQSRRAVLGGFGEGFTDQDVESYGTVDGKRALVWRILTANIRSESFPSLTIIH